MENPNQSHAPNHASESFGNVPNPSAQIGSVPNAAETFRTVPSPSESFGTIPKSSEPFRYERKESHCITVRDAARMFEESGVARTERSIVNWCQPNATGIARLDAYFDPNERRYYITQESIQRTIAEEKAKAFRSIPQGAEVIRNHSESASEKGREHSDGGEQDGGDTGLKKDLLDLQILNAGKDMVIRQLRDERDKWIQQLIEGSKKIGELETRLLQLDEPKNGEPPNGSSRD